MALSEGESALPPACSLDPLAERSEGGGRQMRWRWSAGTLINGRVAHRPSHSVAHLIQREQARERERERERWTERDVRRPMSRHRSSHNTTDTNPGSVPLAPDCHKSDKRQPAGRREKAKQRSQKATATQH